MYNRSRDGPQEKVHYTNAGGSSGFPLDNFSSNSFEQCVSLASGSNVLIGRLRNAGMGVKKLRTPKKIAPALM